METKLQQEVREILAGVYPRPDRAAELQLHLSIESRKELAGIASIAQWCLILLGVIAITLIVIAFRI